MLIQQFQNDLINKLNFKASSKVTSEGLLLKTFKFYDLNGSGSVPRNQFYKAISKIGVVFKSAQQSKQIFDYYDKNSQQKIDYREFITQLLHKPKVLVQRHTQNIQNINLKQSKIESVKPIHESRNLEVSKRSVRLTSGEQVIDYIKTTLRNRGIQSILKLSVDLKESDTNKSHHLSYQRIVNLFNYLKKQDVSRLFQYFKLNAGEINYAQLIYEIRELLSPERTALINSVFQRLDSKQEGEIPIQTVIKNFQSNQLTSRDLFSQYIDLYCKFQGIDDGIFTDEDFTDFFGFIAFYFISTQDFRSYILSAFPEEDRKSVSVRSSRSRRQFQNPSAIKQSQQPIQIVGNFKKKDLKQSHISGLNPHVQKAQSIISHNIPKNQQPERSRISQQSHYVKQIELILIRIKKRLASKGPRGYLHFEKAFKLGDMDQDYFLNLLEFKKIIKQQRIDITETQIHIVFQIFDQESTGLINYPEFIFAIKGEVPQNRKKLIERVWQKVKITEQHTTYNNIKNVFQARSHPDVKNGRKYEQEITKELNESLLLIQDLNGVRNQQIVKEDFFEFLQNLSASTPDNQLFETILVNTWKLGSVHRIQDEYAGSRKLFDMKSNAYLIDHHRYMINGGTVSQNAPFGTYNQKTNYSTESGQKIDF